MAYTDAMYGGSATLEGITGRRTSDNFSIRWMLERREEIPLTAGDFKKTLEHLRPCVLIDARMNKRSVPERQSGLAPLTIGLGPNFIAGETTDLVVETAWEDLGSILAMGSSRPLTGDPRPINGYGRERYVYAPADGRFKTDCAIGAAVAKVQQQVGIVVHLHRDALPFEGSLPEADPGHACDPPGRSQDAGDMVQGIDRHVVHRPAAWPPLSISRISWKASWGCWPKNWAWKNAPCAYWMKMASCI